MVWGLSGLNNFVLGKRGLDVRGLRDFVLGVRY